MFVPRTQLHAWNKGLLEETMSELWVEKGVDQVDKVTTAQWPKARVRIIITVIGNM